MNYSLQRISRSDMPGPDDVETTSNRLDGNLPGNDDRAQSRSAADCNSCMHMASCYPRGTRTIKLPSCDAFRPVRTS